MQPSCPNHKTSLWLALALYWSLLIGLASAAFIRTGGHFGYPQDDTYIHMAIAKHLINDGFLGVTDYGFSSSTSSPLWTFLIALTYWIFGVNDYSLAPHIFILFLASLAIFRWRTQRGLLSEKDGHFARLLALTIFLHLFFARVGWFYRYGAYLVLAGIAVAGRIANPIIDLANRSVQPERTIKAAGTTLLGFFLILPLAIRAVLSHSDFPTGVKNIYEQQYQMALFIEKYYRDSVIAANDIGAINYLSDVKTLDLYGLASLETLQFRQNGTYGTHAIRALVEEKNVEIIVIYTSWYTENIPSEWLEVGRWKIIGKVAAASDEVTFFVPDEAFKQAAIAHLRNFASSLPVDVVQSGLYLQEK